MVVQSVQARARCQGHPQDLDAEEARAGSEGVQASGRGVGLSVVASIFRTNMAELDE